MGDAVRTAFRLAAVGCALLIVLLAFQSLQASASPPDTGAAEYNHALASNGGVATASGSSGTNTPDKAIDGSSATYWQSSTTTGWLAVTFARTAYVDEIHAHFLGTKYKSLSLYYDTNGNGAYETTEKVFTTTSNNALDVIIPTPTRYALGMKLTIDAKVGTSKPQIAEFEAYLRSDTDGDGLTNAQEAGTVYFYESSALDLPARVPDLDSNDSSLVVNRLSGSVFRGLADFTIDHGRKEDLSAVLAYWSGSAWVDVPAWDPGRWLTKPTIVYPAGGQKVRGIVQVQAAVEQPSVVASLEFFVDGVSRNTTSNANGHAYYWNWDTSGMSQGSHTAKARSHDVWNGFSDAQVTVSVDNTAPAVSISASKSQVCPGDVVTVTGSASDTGGLDSVTFFTLYDLSGETTWGPVSRAVAIYSAQTFTITAVDLAGNTATASVSVGVWSGCGPPPCEVGEPCIESSTDAVTESMAEESSQTLSWPGDGFFISPNTATVSAGIGKSATEAGYSITGTRHRIVVNLTNPISGMTGAEQGARIAAPGLVGSTLNVYQTWRLTITDWSSGFSGSIASFLIRLEERTSGTAADSDGDTVRDGEEAIARGSFPVAVDTDIDGLSDGFEAVGRPLTLWKNGNTSIVAGIATNLTRWDTDGDGLADGQEWGFATTGQVKVIGEVGIAKDVGSAWKTVYLRNRYASAVVIAEPPTFRTSAFAHVRLNGITDHTFQLKLETWAVGATVVPEDVAYLVIEAGNHVLPDGSIVEAGTKAGVGTSGTTITFREAFEVSPEKIIQAQTAFDPAPVVAQRQTCLCSGSLAFGVYLNANGSASHTAETVGYVAISSQPDPDALATWTRQEVPFVAKTGTWTFPANFSARPLVLGWMSGTDPRNVGIRLSSVTNSSVSAYREQVGLAPRDALEFFVFAGPMNLTARTTMDPTAADTDGDGIGDGTEVGTYGSSPVLTDTDRDGIPDGVEVADRSITVPVNGTATKFTFKTSPTSDDTDADGVKDPDELAGILDHRIAFYDMETTLADGRMRDWSGNGGHGTLSGTMNVTGKVGNAWSFAGSNYIQASDADVLDASTITVAAWVSVSTGAGTYNPIVAKGQSGVVFQYYMDVRKVGGAWKLNAQISTVAGPGASATSTGSITAATWTHVAFTFDGSTVRLYINGAADPTAASLSGSLRNTIHPLRIGQYYGSTSYFTGSIDEIQLWDRALSQDEIAQYSASDLPVVRFDMESTRSDGKLADFAGKGNAGTVFATSVTEGRIGFARSFAPAASSVNVTDSASLNFNTAGLTISAYILASSAPASDVSLLAKKGEFYLNLSSDGLVRFTIYTKTPLVSQLPLPVNRWVRVSASTDATTMALYFDEVLMGSATGFKPADTTNPITLGRAEGCSPICPRFTGSLDELVVYAKGIAQTALARSSARGILLNPNATDTDGDGLADGQELYVKSFKTEKRFPGSKFTTKYTDPVTLSLSAPAWALARADAMVGVTSADMSSLVVWLRDPSGGEKALRSCTSVYGGPVNCDASANVNYFASFDLAQMYDLGVLTKAGAWKAKTYDWADDPSTPNDDANQIEYLQLQVTMHTLPNRADTDGDGLNDSEEVNLGSDGFQTDPWKADTDGDGLADNEYFVKGTSPVRRDTDLDGHDDSLDRYPLQDIFIQVIPWSATLPAVESTADDGSGGDAYLEPFLVVRYGGQAWYSAADLWASDTALWGPPYTSEFYVNVADDATSVSLTVELWDWDFDVSNPDPIDISTASGMQNTGTCTASLLAVGQGATCSFFGSNLGNSGLYARPFEVRVGTVAPTRAPTWLLVPNDYSGAYNVTDSGGNLLSRRYVGEPRFVAFTIDQRVAKGVTAQTLYLVPRSTFHDTQFADLLERKALPASLASALTFAENGTTSANSDDLQMVLAGHLGGTDRTLFVDLLSRNATGGLAYRWIVFGDDVVVLGLPDDAIRFAAYIPFPHTTSINYTWDVSTGTKNGWSVWDQLWTGAVAFLDDVLTWIESAIVFVATVADAIVQAIVAFGSWVADLTSGDPVRVANAVQAAQNVLNQFVDWITDAVVTLVNSFLNALVAPLVNSFEGLLDAITLMALTVQKPGKGSVMSGEFATAYDGFVIALARVLLLISTFQLLLLAVDIGLTALSLTGFGSVVMVAAEVAVIVAFALVASHLVAAIETVFLDILSPALAFSALVLAVIGTFVAVISALTPQWTETTYTVVRNDFRGVYGELVDQVNIKPVITVETRRVYSQTAGSGTAILLAIFALAIISLQLALLASTADPITKTIAAIVLDTVAIVIAVRAVVDAAGLPSITSLSRWSKALAPVSLGVSAAAFSVDLLKYQSLEGQSA